MKVDYRIIPAPLFALALAVACGDSETVLGRGGTGGSDSGAETGGSSTGTGATAGTGGRATGTGGRAAGGSSGSGNGGSSGNGGAGASAGGGSGDGGPTGDGSSAAGGSAGAGGASAGGAGGAAAGGAGGAAAGGAGGRAAGGAGGRGAGGGPVGTACERLADCCDTVPPAVQTQCRSYVTLNQQPQCGVVLGIFCPSPDAGPAPTQDAANACSALAACCPTAGAQQAQCEQTVSLANPGLCNVILSVLCP